MAKEAAAMRTLERRGYTYHGGAEWKPPLGSAPNFDLVAAKDAEIARLRAEVEALRAATWCPTHRHKKRGTTYRLLGYGRLQCEGTLPDMADVAIYQGEARDLWARPPAEFEDGRFEVLPQETPGA